MIQLNSPQALETYVMRQGFLPLFRNEIPQFSVEEHTPQELWFSDETDGPWEWKGPIAGNGNCVYSKLFRGKAGFVSLEWFPELVNYRRSAYKLSTEGSETKDRLIYNTVLEYESLLSKEIKALCGYKKTRSARRFEPVESFESKMAKELNTKPRPKGEGFETIMTRLQMGTWLVVADFEYLYDKQMRPYGWGIARYTTPEALLGESTILACRGRSPEESKQRLVEYLSGLLPQATEEQILRIIG